jgi:hypothetical protein
MVSPRVPSIKKALVEFSLGLKEYESYWLMAKTKGMTRKQTEEMMSLRETLLSEAGKLNPIITKLTGEKRIQSLEKGLEYVYDIWPVALGVNWSSQAHSALIICIDYTDRAKGKLDDDIASGIRDKEGNVIEKSQAIAVEPTEVSVVLGKKNLKPVSKTNWEAIEKEFGVTKNGFRKRINFVSDSYKREILFRDVEHAFVLASSGFSKSAVILAGSVIEELLRLYLKHKAISPKKPSKNDLNGYVQTCKQQGLLKNSVSGLPDSVRQFTDLVHISREENNRHTISKLTAKTAVTSIFTIVNDF